MSENVEFSEPQIEFVEYIRRGLLTSAVGWVTDEDQYAIRLASRYRERLSTYDFCFQIEKASIKRREILKEAKSQVKQESVSVVEQ
jgi:hypothetical protein